MKMKKMICFLTAALILFLLAGCGSSAPASSAAPAASASEKMPELSTRLSDSYLHLMQGNRYLMRYRGLVTAEGQSIEMECTTAVVGTNFSSTVVTEGMTLRTLYLDGSFYTVNDTGKTYSLLSTAPAQTDDVIDAESLEYVGGGSAQRNGKQMEYEEYRTEDGTVRFYFDGKALSAIVTTTEDGEAVMEILELSDKVTDDMVALPADYTESANIPSAGGQLSAEDQAALNEMLEELNGVELPEGVEIPNLSGTAAGKQSS